MFLYNEDIEEEKLVISIPSKVQYDFTFLNNTTEMMKKVEQSQYKKILFSCMEKNINFDKMGAAYLYNMLVFFAKTRSIFIDKPLYQIFHNKVSHSGGEQFDKIDIKKVSRSDIQQCYSIKNDKYVNQIVQILVDFISETNLVLERAREFLITTVGEIFSNAFGHSNEEKVFFMYDIGRYNHKFYLVINITDYGKTIIHNVQSYHEKNFNNKLNSCECIRWAIKEGNTTRLGSGGYGLPTLIDYVCNVAGELLIFSGDSIYALKGTVENILNSKGDFYGTSISMKIPLFDTSKAIMYDEESKRIVSIDLDKI